MKKEEFYVNRILKVMMDFYVNYVCKEKEND